MCGTRTSIMIEANLKKYMSQVFEESVFWEFLFIITVSAGAPLVNVQFLQLKSPTTHARALIFSVDCAQFSCARPQRWLRRHVSYASECRWRVTGHAGTITLQPEIVAGPRRCGFRCAREGGWKRGGVEIPDMRELQSEYTEIKCYIQFDRRVQRERVKKKCPFYTDSYNLLTSSFRNLYEK